MVFSYKEVTKNNLQDKEFNWSLLSVYINIKYISDIFKD